MNPIRLNPIKLMLAAITLILPAIIWNTVLLDYINSNGKLIPWLLTGPIAYLSTGIFQGFANSNLPPIVKSKINPFWGWFICSLAIEIFITAASNT